MEGYEAILADMWNIMKGRIILTAAELDLFSHLHKRKATAAELASSLGLDTRATTRILDCLVAFDLLKKDYDIYEPTGVGIYLSKYHPETALPFLHHFRHLWDNWSSLTEVVRKGGNRKKRSSPQRSEADMKAFIGAMHAIGKDLSREIADFYDLSRFKQLLDIGGASGTYTIAFLRKNPGMNAVIFDLPDVIGIAKKQMRKEGLHGRVKFATGDFYKDALPAGADLALLSAIIHQNNPKQNLALFKKVHRALVRGGVLLIRDHIMDESRTNPPAGTVFALNMLVGTHSGDTYTFREVRDALEKAGFAGVRLLRTGPKMDCLVEATKG
ncbi:MAG: methyltransferase [Syntrophorhabdaceae bacterium]|nr:methyltransferase [Syntrophorhabdaceae bacterium]MDD5242820.1 methyltransferase [Syntrophorhabdaceae bacterium]